MQTVTPSTAPDVSVVIAAWKAAAFIHHAIDSALASEGVTVEVIVVDDASPDSTYDTVTAIAAKDPRVRVDRCETNGGPSQARNRAIAMAHGTFIAVLDADDAMDAHRLRDLVKLAEASHADVAVDNLLEVDELNRPVGDGRFLKSDAFQRPQQISLETWIRHNHPMERGDCLGYLKPLFRRTALDRLAATYDPALRNSEDYYIVANMLAAGARMAYAPSRGYRYTRSAASTSHRLKPEQTQAWLKAETAFVARHAAKLSSTEQAALRIRMRKLRDVHQFVGTVAAISARSPARIVRTLAADPAGWPFTFSWFGKIAADKLRARARRTPA
jgi:succinoglycan biosynthesis protein ExoO